MNTQRLCLNAKDVSESTGVSLSKIRKLTRCGEIPHIKIGRRILYPVAALDEWLSQNTIGRGVTKNDGEAND